MIHQKVAQQMLPLLNLKPNFDTNDSCESLRVSKNRVCCSFFFCIAISPFDHNSHLLPAISLASSVAPKISFYCRYHDASEFHNYSDSCQDDDTETVKLDVNAKETRGRGNSLFSTDLVP